MKKNKKIYINIIIICIFIIIVICGVYYYGTYLGKRDTRNERNIKENWSFKNEKFQLLLIKSKEYTNYDVISDVSLKIKEIDKKNNRIVLVLLCHSENNGSLDETTFESFYLEKEMNNKWYILDMRTIKAVPTNNITKRKVDFRKRV